MSQTFLDSQKMAAVWSGCRKTEVMGMCWVGGWHLLHLVILHDHADGAGAIPNKVAWGILDPSLDPLSRSWLRKDWPSTLCASSYADEDDSLGPPSPRVGSPSNHGGRQPLMWQTGSQNISHIWGLACNALFAGGWQWCPHCDPLSQTKGSGSAHWSGVACLDCVCHQPHYLWGLGWGYCSEKYQALW